MSKQRKAPKEEKKVRNKLIKAATKVTGKKPTGSDKKKIKSHRDFLRGLEKRREQLVIANRATHNQHGKELEELDKQIVEWKQRIAEESGTVEKKAPETTAMEED